MKPEMRQQLAQLPFEEKIRKVGQLIQLARNVKGQPLRGSLKGTKAMDVFMSERKREREESRELPPKNSKK
jgi:hypothetical protein